MTLIAFGLFRKSTSGVVVNDGIQVAMPDTLPTIEFAEPVDVELYTQFSSEIVMDTIEVEILHPVSATILDTSTDLEVE